MSQKDGFLESLFSPVFLIIVRWLGYLLLIALLINVVGCDEQRERSRIDKCVWYKSIVKDIEDCISMEGCIIEMSDLNYLRRMQGRVQQHCHYGIVE